MQAIIAEVEGTVAADLSSTFLSFGPIDLSLILRGYGPLPAVRAVEKQTGAWDAVGQTREIVLEDGSRMHERLTAVNAPHGFDYTVDSFTGALRHLVREMQGSWRFEADAADATRTRARWRYEFHCTHAWAIPISIPIIRWLWTPTMQRALRAATEITEARFQSEGQRSC